MSDKKTFYEYVIILSEGENEPMTFTGDFLANSPDEVKMMAVIENELTVEQVAQTEVLVRPFC